MKRRGWRSAEASRYATGMRSILGGSTAASEDAKDEENWDVRTMPASAELIAGVSTIVEMHLVCGSLAVVTIVPDSQMACCSKLDAPAP